MRNTTAILLLSLFLVIRPDFSVAEDWHDDFDEENREAWQIIGNESIWKVEDGRLHAEVNRDWGVQYELYQFIALPPPYRNFTITIHDLGGDKTRFGFAVGRRFPDTPEEDPFFYVFFPDEIRARRFDGKGSSHPFRTRLSREPRDRWETDTLAKMELKFNSGHFVLFTDDALRTGFEDANFEKIEILGFVMEGLNIANEWVGAAWADSFTISGLNVSPELRLTQIWAYLKQ